MPWIITVSSSTIWIALEPCIDSSDKLFDAEYLKNACLLLSSENVGMLQAIK